MSLCLSTITYRVPNKTPPQAKIKPFVLDNLPELLRGYRIRNKLTKSAFARLIGTTEPSYYAWEIGKHVPMQAYRQRIHKLLKREFSTSSRLRPKVNKKNNYFRSIESACEIVDNLKKQQVIDKHK